MNLSIPGIRIHREWDDRASIYCPVHKGGQEARPAAYIYFRRGTWRCHACGQGGPLSQLLENLGMDGDKARQLASDLKEIAPRDAPRRVALPACPEYYLGAFNRRPLNLVKAGFAREVLDEMEVGFDDTRSRVIYTVRSESGILHGVVGGAILPEDHPEYPLYYGTEPKYLAYGPNQGFPFQVNPKWTLWNHNRIQGQPQERPAVVVEGFKALLWVRMAGFPKVVATYGAAYESGQVDLIHGIGSSILLFLDNDAPGRAATKRLRADLRRRMPGVGLVRYPRPVKQPDDLTLDEVRTSLDRG